MEQFRLKETARRVRLAMVPVACVALVSACATYETRSTYESRTAPAATTTVTVPAATPVTVQNYQALRASDIIGKSVRNQHGQYMGQMHDLVVQMATGEVRYAVVTPGAGDQRFYAVPVRGIRAGAGNEFVIDAAKPRLADHRWWTRWPDMQDIAFWSELDRVSGFSPVQPAHGYDRFSQLRGKLVVDTNGVHLGHIEDFVINARNDVLHYAIVSLQPGRAGGGRLVAVPLHAFAFPREGVNRLALSIDASRLPQLETFDAASWARLNDPAYIARIDRYFVSAFPPATVSSLFDQLDTNRDGFLSRSELAPLQMAGTDRYVVHGRVSEPAAFHALDRDGDGFLNKAEADALLRNMPAGTFARYDTNGDGFLSMAEAAPLLGSVAPSAAAGVTFDQLDRDRDGFVNRAEAAALMPAPAPAVAVREVVIQPEVSFEVFDVDRDGHLSRMEAAALLNRYGVGAANFDRYDLNRDGFLSRAEIDRMMQDRSIGGTGGEAARGAFGR